MAPFIPKEVWVLPFWSSTSQIMLNIPGDLVTNSHSTAPPGFISISAGVPTTLAMIGAPGLKYSAILT
ncbi:MAG: hypothetical protein CMM74_10700 [Rhodospirillaceae bacterium]|jgi:hypothetical protein|nr:hypothetical protein [Rhodospirillaceae bacterium]